MSDQTLPQDLNIVAMYAIPADSDVVMKESDSIKKAESKNTEDQQQQQEEDFDGIISFTLETKKKDKIDAAIAQSQHQQDTSDGYESSDLSSSDDDDDDDDNNNDHVQNGDVEDIEDDLDDEGNKEPTEPLRTKHELVHIIIDTVNFEITPATKLTPIGTIEEIIDNVIVVHSHPDMANTVLDMGTLFAFEDRTTMGEVFETFGPVSRPYYSVRFNSPDEIDKGKATVGAQVSYVPMYERTKLVPVEELRKKTYTDASNAYDEEISDEVYTISNII
ncbi:Gar1/Naf1 RNA binding region-domain-containing protein [Phascolomyces articulosus]|uniref:H/ACA ribonucleoprotein complex subunit n=1 Tax=Phascolomyces articulosus TaxID=60185 RepID=A0AAD5JYP1_9FUNG|nr:Gar1/Naf1 RNA binding region-domain-containing protein [Phascolomyces articulosus]